MELDNLWIKKVNSFVSDERILLREENAKIDAALVKWEYVQLPSTEEGIKSFFESVEKKELQPAGAR